MRAYVATTGIISALITVAHLARTREVLSHTGDDRWFVAGFTALTLISASIAVWAYRIFRRLPSSRDTRPAA